MEEKTKFGRSMTTNWISKPSYLPGRSVEKSRSGRFQVFFRRLDFSHFSKSLLVLSGLQSPSRNSGSASSSSAVSASSDEPGEGAKFCNSPSESSISDSSSIRSWSLSRSSSVPSSPSPHAKRSSSGRHRGLDGRKPVLLEKVPFGKWGKYLTVYIGAHPDQCVKYVICRSLLKHPLFQLLLKCSEDEFGDDYTVNKGVAIVCDPELFLEVVRAVEDNLWSLGNDSSQVERTNA